MSVRPAERKLSTESEIRDAVTLFMDTSDEEFTSTDATIATLMASFHSRTEPDMLAALQIVSKQLASAKFGGIVSRPMKGVSDETAEETVVESTEAAKETTPESGDGVQTDGKMPQDLKDAIEYVADVPKEPDAPVEDAVEESEETKEVVDVKDVVEANDINNTISTQPGISVHRHEFDMLSQKMDLLISLLAHSTEKTEEVLSFARPVGQTASLKTINDVLGNMYKKPSNVKTEALTGEFFAKHPLVADGVGQELH